MEAVEVCVYLQPGEVGMREGDDSYVLTDRTPDSLGGTIPPIRRAVMAARLRALADVIEKTGEQ